MHRAGVANIEAVAGRAAGHNHELIDVAEHFRKALYQLGDVGERADGGDVEFFACELFRQKPNGGQGLAAGGIALGARHYGHIGALQSNDVLGDAQHGCMGSVAVHRGNAQKINALDVQRLNDGEPVVDVARPAVMPGTERNIGIDDEGYAFIGRLRHG